MSPSTYSIMSISTPFGLLIQLSGRITADNARNVEDDIIAIREDDKTTPIVIDVDDLVYVSSAGLYLDLSKRMPEGWELAFCGLFRGRPHSPLRVCGYLSNSEGQACASDRAHLVSIFDTVGFSHYDEEMLEQVTAVMNVAPGSLDYQFDIYPDRTIGDTFAIDMQFGIEQPAQTMESFKTGVGARAMSLLEKWGVADSRWHAVAEASFARALVVPKPDGTLGRYSFTLFPLWVKVRWCNGVLQPAKLYFFARAGFLDENSDSTTQPRAASSR